MSKTVITGIGFTSAYGHTWDHHRHSMLRPECLISPIPYFDTTQAGIRFGGIAPSPDLGLLPKRKLQKLLSHKDLMLVTAACAASHHANWHESRLDSQRLGCFLNTCSSQLADLFPYFECVLDCVSADHTVFDSHKFGSVAASRVNPLAATKVLLNGSLSHISEILGIKGPNTTTMDGELGTFVAIQQAHEYISEGTLDLAVVGAVSAPFDPLYLTDEKLRDRLISFESGSTFADVRPLWQPYHPNSHGMIPAEGACVMILESEESARSRDCQIWGELNAIEVRDFLDGDESRRRMTLSSLLQGASQDQSPGRIICGGGAGDPNYDRVELAALTESSVANGVCCAYGVGYLFEAHPIWQIAMGLSLLGKSQIPKGLQFTPASLEAPISEAQTILHSPQGCALAEIRS